MNNTQPKVSIIVPIYNVEQYLRRCLDSLVKQSIGDVEIILVNDGSPDGSPAICDEYAKQDDRIVVIHKQNAGLGFARNSGLEIARGKYVAFVDSDDYVSLDMYEKLYDYAESALSDVVFCGYKKEISNARWVDCIDHSTVTLFQNSNDVRNLALEFIASKPHSKKERNYSMSVWHSIYNLNMIKLNKIEFCSEREVVSEDLPFQVDIFNHASQVLFVPDVLYYHCLNGASLSNTFLDKKYERFKILYSCLSDKLVDDAEAKNRINKLFIGYVRSYIFKLINSNLSKIEKYNILRFIINDSIWQEIESEYKPQNLSMMPRILYSNILSKNTLFLYYYAKFILRVRKYIGK